MRNRNPKQVYSPPCSIQSCRKKVSFCSCFFNRQTVSSSLLQEFQGYLSLLDWVCDILWRRTGLTATLISSRYTVHNGSKIVLKSNSNLKIESNNKFFKLSTFYKVNFMKKSREINLILIWFHIGLGFVVWSVWAYCRVHFAYLDLVYSC